jgi:hypothetical protein
MEDAEGESGANEGTADRDIGGYLRRAASPGTGYPSLLLFRLQLFGDKRLRLMFLHKNRMEAIEAILPVR